MSLSSNYPTVRPSLLLDFANTKTLDPRITFTRASVGTYYDGKTVAKAEENLAIYSQEFDNAAWINSQTTETANSTTAPDGTSTADTLDDGTAASVAHDTSQSVTVTAATTYTLSAYFKNIDRQYVVLAFSTSANNWIGAKFDLVAGTVGSTSAAGAGFSVTSSSITSVGSSWYRCSVTFVSGATGVGAIRLGMATDSTTFTASQRGLEVYTGSNKTIYIWGAQLEQRSAVTAYTPTTTAPITNYNQQLMTAASGVARFDHNPLTDESLGLLIEEARTNVFTYSDDFTNASWVKARATISSNVIVSPDGTLNGDKLVEDTTASNSHFVEKTYSTTSGTVYTFTVYAKAGERTKTVLQANTTINHSCIFDLAAGTASTGTNCTGSISPVGNGWYRCSIVLTASTTGTSYFDIFVYTTTSTYTGDGWSGIYIWGAQLEAGAFATSYIPTTTAAVTRPVDSVTMTGTNFSSWYTVNEGTMYAEGTTFGTTGLGRAFVGDQSLRYFLYKHAGNNGAVYDGTTVTLSGTAVNTYPAFSKLIMNYGSSQQSICVNGGAIVSGVSSGFASSTALTIGGPSAAASNLNGTIKKIAFYPKRLTNAQLQALTTV